jgi:hypothetical protein
MDLVAPTLRPVCWHVLVRRKSSPIIPLNSEAAPLSARVLCHGRIRKEAYQCSVSATRSPLDGCTRRTSSFFGGGAEPPRRLHTRPTPSTLCTHTVYFVRRPAVRGFRSSGDRSSTEALDGALSERAAILLAVLCHPLRAKNAPTAERPSTASVNGTIQARITCRSHSSR